jgi:glutathione S-transferase
MQYLADLAPVTVLAPAAGTIERYRLQEWLTFISSELPKMFSPWLFHLEHGEPAKEAAKAKIGERFAFLERHLAAAPHLMGERFSAADSYAFTIVGWSRVACALEDAGHGTQRRLANREANSNDSNL